MSAELQSVVALLLVALAAVYLVRVSRKRRGGGSDCGGCGPDKFKASLKR